jgi:hypothetical protein
MKDYNFLVSTVFWYDLQFQINYISKHDEYIENRKNIILRNI